MRISLFRQRRIKPLMLHYVLVMSALVFATMAGVTPGLANDSVARIAGGGLVLGQTDAIEMRSEELYLARDRVRVKYRFFNHTKADARTIVAFPLPVIPPPSNYDNVVIPFEKETANFVRFSTRVDGKPVPMKIDQRAVAVGVDRTDVLSGLGIPLANYSSATRSALKALPADQLSRLSQLGLVGDDEFNTSGGKPLTTRPLWSLRTTYYWEQLFPAGKEIVVEHAYTPATGVSVQTMVGTDYEGVDLSSHTKRYCIDEPVVRAAKRIQRKNASGQGAILTEYDLEYILSTGANWSGPIKKFRLIVDKGSTRNLVSFCGDGVRKTGPTTFEMVKTDYWPTGELHVLFLVRQDNR